jgi:LacI family transcriptional regulator
LENSILDGVYKVGEALPSFKQLAEYFEVSIVTINQAMNELNERGRIIRKRGKAIYVAPLDGRNRLSQRIGLIVPDIANPHFSTLAKLIQKNFFNQNYAVITQSTDGNLSLLNRILRLQIQQKMDGIVLIPLEINRTEQERILWELKIRGIAFVYLDDNFSRVPSDYVICCIESGVRFLTEHLLHLGHRQFACISAQPCLEITQLKIRYFREILQANQIELPEERICISEKPHDEGGYEAARALLQSANPPQAIFATNDIIAFGVIRAANSLNLRVPDDLSVVGFDDIEMAHMFDPPLTTVAQPIAEMAERVVHILLERIAGTLPMEFQQSVLIPNLVVRESTAAPARR